MGLDWDWVLVLVSTIAKGQVHWAAPILFARYGPECT
jgi:hypothetical protein